MLKYKHCKRILSCLVFLVPSLSYAELPQENIRKQSYEAVYKTNIKGFRLKTKRIFSVSEDNKGNQHYQLSMDTRHFLLDIIEQSQFSFDASQQLLSHQYHYTKDGVGRDKSVQISIKHENSTYASTERVNEGEYALPAQTLPLYDKLNYQLQLRIDLQRLGKDFGQQSYHFVEKGNIRTYTFLLKGKETRSTPMGNFESWKLERVRSHGSQRQTFVWIAPQLKHMIIEILQQEDKDHEFKLELMSVKF